MPDFDIIGYAHTDFPDKFGIPRQSGLADTEAFIVFEKKYRDISYLRRLDEYSHIWLIWMFSKLDKDRKCSPTVRPPRLGGNVRVGVFASRSPYRPNPIGLSSVKILRIYTDAVYGPVIRIKGADLADNTPILDIKPYLSYTDSHPDSVCGFADKFKDYKLRVECSPELLLKLPERLREAAVEVLSLDPRPSYHGDDSRIYGFSFGGFEIKFKVSGNILIIKDIYCLK